MSGIPSDDPWVQFIWEYPGPQGVNAEAAFADAVKAGIAPSMLVAQARAYRRLCDVQDALAVPADLWLATLTESVDDDVEGATEPMAFSAAVRALRAVKGWSQKELAAKAEVSTLTLQQIENEPEAHQSRRSTRLTVADALGWSVEEMVDLGYAVLAR